MLKTSFNEFFLLLFRSYDIAIIAYVFMLTVNIFLIDFNLWSNMRTMCALNILFSIKSG